MSFVQTAPMAAMKNRKALTASAGCYKCFAVVTAEEVKHWTDNGETALCPQCCFDCLLPNVVDKATLAEVNRYWLSPPKSV